MFKLLSSAFGVFLVSLVVFAYVGEKNQDMIMTKLGNYFKADGEDIQEFIKNMRDGSHRHKFDETKYTSEEVSYFNEIVYDGIERGKPVHSNYVMKYTEDVKIYMEGHQPSYIVEELNRIVGELNDIINPIEVYVVNNKSEANMIVSIGSSKTVSDKYPVFNEYDNTSARGRVCLNLNKGNYANIMLNTDNIESVDRAKHVLREEITQALGLCHDSMTYPESIFYDGECIVTEYAPIDRVLIDILYNN
jgi:hypothetical protein